MFHEVDERFRRVRFCVVIPVGFTDFPEHDTGILDGFIRPAVPAAVIHIPFAPVITGGRQNMIAIIVQQLFVSFCGCLCAASKGLQIVYSDIL
jgi:hypothetical protein